MTRRETCRLCDGRHLRTIIDLGNQRLSEFRDDDVPPPCAPLELTVCTACDLVQLRHTTSPGLLYHDRYSFRSGVSDAVRRDLQGVAEDALRSWRAGRSKVFEDAFPRRWLDVACNDGTLLAFVPCETYRVCIDPLEHLTTEALRRRYADHALPILFDADAARPYGPFDVITCVSMFYDLDDPIGFLEGVESVLADRGVVVVQQNYLPYMLAATSIDNVSHEHLAYYSLTTFQRVVRETDLEVIDVTFSPINGGCFRTTLARRGEREVSARVGDTLAREDARAKPLDSLDTYMDFRDDAHTVLANVRDLVTRVNQVGLTVWVYGASTRGAVLWQAAHLDARHLPYVVERNPEKVGRYMSAIGARIVSEEHMRAERPNFLLVGPWWLRDDFIRREEAYLRAGGRFIFPLPRLEVVGDEVLDPVSDPR